MKAVGRIIVAVLRFLGISLLFAVGLFVLVSLSCLIFGPCTNAAYSERMFWSALAVSIAGMPAALASLSTTQGYFGNAFTAGQDMKVAQTIIEDGRLSLTKRTNFMWRALTVGAFGIGFAALIDLLG